MIEQLIEQKLEIERRITHARNNLVIAKACAPESIHDCIEQSKLYQLEYIIVQKQIDLMVH